MIIYLSHPTVGVALFGSNVSERLSFSCEELLVSMIILLVHKELVSMIILLVYKELRMRAGCRRHTWSVKGCRGLGVERMVKGDIVTSVSVVVVVRVKVKDNAKWWKK